MMASQNGLTRWALQPLQRLTPPLVRWGNHPGAPLALFGAALVVRLLYWWLSPANAYELTGDAHWIVALSDHALRGDFRFDIGRFVVAPLYQTLIAGYKLAFGPHWSAAMQATQVLLSALCAPVLFGLGRRLFGHPGAALVGAGAFVVYPFTLWWTFTLATEAVFQALVIFCVGLLVRGVQLGRLGAVVSSAVCFSLAFLTKSHLLLFAPFVVLYLLLNLPWRRAVAWGAVYAAISLAATLPFGLYNLRHQGAYVLSSNGAAFQFYLGNSPAGYATVVEVPQPGTWAWYYVKNLPDASAYFNGPSYYQLLALPQAEKQAAFMQWSLDWIAAHPRQFIKLKLANLGYFLWPGVSPRHYPWPTWFVTLLLALPVYVGAYVGLGVATARAPRHHAWMWGLVANILLLSVVWYVQNRFRTITLEPFYLLYFGWAVLGCPRPAGPAGLPGKGAGS